MVVSDIVEPFCEFIGIITGLITQPSDMSEFEAN